MVVLVGDMKYRLPFLPFHIAGKQWKIKSNSDFLEYFPRSISFRNGYLPNNVGFISITLKLENNFLDSNAIITLIAALDDVISMTDY